MNETDDRELRRVMLQADLDSFKSKGERNRLGQFATPSALAHEILSFTKGLLKEGQPVRFLDPAFGTGSFYSALIRSLDESIIDRASGYEIDGHYADASLHFWNGTPLQLYAADFTKAEPPALDSEKFNLLICNPPYVRHHHISAAEKSRLQSLSSRMSGVRPNGLSGLYCHFLCISLGWMSHDGVGAWLIPSEFMDVNYGAAIRNLLLSRVSLIRIHRFDPRSVQFDDATVSSVVVWFRNSKPVDGHTVELSFGKNIQSPESSIVVPAMTLAQSHKWTQLSGTARLKKSSGAGLRLSDIFEIKRGVATGANDYFILDGEAVAENELPTDVLIPILPSPRCLATDVVPADSAGNPIVDPRLFLLSCNLPVDDIRRQFPALHRYLLKGIEAGVPERYLCKHRSPWYSQEVRRPAPFLCTYMGRTKSRSGLTFRFVLNLSKAIAANVYLLLYPRPALAAAMESKPELLQSLWQALNNIDPSCLISAGRVYGGGLHKVEPKELASAVLDDFPSAVSSVIAKSSQITIF